MSTHTIHYYYYRLSIDLSHAYDETISIIDIEKLGGKCLQFKTYLRTEEPSIARMRTVAPPTSWMYGRMDLYVYVDGWIGKKSPNRMSLSINAGSERACDDEEGLEADDLYKGNATSCARRFCCFENKLCSNNAERVS